MRSLVFVSAFTMLSGFAPVQAATLFNNITTTPYNGNCLFSSVCAATFDAGDIYAAQAFTLDTAAKLTSASFAEYDYGVVPTTANWIIASADGSLPGASLFSGSSQITGSTTFGSQYGYSLSQVDFDLGKVNLQAGSYFFALQAVSPTFYTYLANGLFEGGGAETHDGGNNWSVGYEGMSSVGVALNGTTLSAVPLPAAAPMFGAALLAMGGLGYAKRRKAAASAA